MILPFDYSFPEDGVVHIVKLRIYSPKEVQKCSSKNSRLLECMRTLGEVPLLRSLPSNLFTVFLFSLGIPLSFSLELFSLQRNEAPVHYLDALLKKKANAILICSSLPLAIKTDTSGYHFLTQGGSRITGQSSRITSQLGKGVEGQTLSKATHSRKRSCGNYIQYPVLFEYMLPFLIYGSVEVRTTT